MDEHLTRFVDKAGRNPAFFAHTLRRFAELNGMDEAALCEHLGVDAERLAHLKLCRTPRLDADGFRIDTERLASAFGVELRKLARVVTEVATTVAFQEEQAVPGRDWALAARDRPPSDEGNK